MNIGKNYGRLGRKKKKLSWESNQWHEIRIIEVSINLSESALVKHLDVLYIRGNQLNQNIKHMQILLLSQTQVSTNKVTQQNMIKVYEYV